MGERREGWKNGERWEKGEIGWEKDGGEMRETRDKGKKGRSEKGVDGERKEKRSGRRLLPVPSPLIYSGTVFVFLESQMHITPIGTRFVDPPFF